MNNNCRYCGTYNWGKHSCNNCGGEKPHTTYGKYGDLGWKSIAGSVIIGEMQGLGSYRNIRFVNSHESDAGPYLILPA